MCRDRAGTAEQNSVDVVTGEVPDLVVGVGAEQAGELAVVGVQGAGAFPLELEPGQPVGEVAGGLALLVT